MYRGTDRQCPACRAAMLVVQIGQPGSEIDVDICDACRAAFFDFEDGTPAELARALDAVLPDVDVEQSRFAPQSARCARCLRPMVPHPSLDGVYRCRACWSVFATCKGLDSLARVITIRFPNQARAIEQLVVGFGQDPPAC